MLESQVGFRASEGMDVLTRREQAGKEQSNLPSFIVLIEASRRRCGSDQKCTFSPQDPDAFQPQDVDRRLVVFLPQGHKCALHFWTVIHSR